MQGRLNFMICEPREGITYSKNLEGIFSAERNHIEEQCVGNEWAKVNGND